jgi:hypothetical protein
LQSCSDEVRGVLVSGTRIAHCVSGDFLDRGIGDTLALMNDPAIDDCDEVFVAAKNPFEPQFVLLRPQFDRAVGAIRSRRIAE